LSIATFFKELSITSAAVAIVLLGVHQVPACQHLPPFSWSCWLFFIVFSIIVYAMGYQSARSPNRQKFTNTTVGFIFYKMMLSVAFVFIYVKVMEPTDSLFLIPFFIIYLCFTIFETHFMIKLGKMRPRRQ